MPDRTAATSALPALALAALAAALSRPLPAAAQERPREEDLFGAPPAQAPAAERPAPSPGGETASPGRPAEAEVLSGTGADAAEAKVAGRLKETDNPLQIGGQLYLRYNVFAREDQPPSQWGMNSPNVADLFLDVRPSDRLRGYALLRGFYDPTQAQGATPLLIPVGVASLPAGKTTEMVLDQLWISFDVSQRAFVTAGKQHVKWGTGRVWNPTDFLHTQRRDPLQVFDTRGGTYMARVQVPLGEQRGGLMAAAVLEPLAPQVQPLVYQSDQPPPQSSSVLGAVGGAARAEVVLGEWEFGVDGVAQRGMKPRAGLDVSGGLWELDLRGEVAFRTGSDVPALRPGPETVTVPGSGVQTTPWQRYQPGFWIQAVGSAEWTTKYSDEDTLTIGAEYFYNQAGYDDPAAYPVLIGWNAYVPLYLGRHYLALSLLFPKPGSWNDTTITLTGIANLSDRSGVVRLDWSTTFLTWLRFEFYLQGHLGHLGGELHFGGPVTFFDAMVPVSVPAPAADAGVALRVAL